MVDGLMSAAVSMPEDLQGRSPGRADVLDFRPFDPVLVEESFELPLPHACLELRHAALPGDGQVQVGGPFLLQLAKLWPEVV